MTRPIKRLLLITYFYPPMQTAASYRTVSFAKYLPRLGFNVTVLTVMLNRFTWNGAVDTSIPDSENVYRTYSLHMGEALKTLSKNRFSGYGQTRVKFQSKQSSMVQRFLAFFYDNVLTFPDPAWSWYLVGRKKAIRVAMRVKPDLLLSSAMPISAHLLARHIKKRLRIPWIADYRDLWSQSHIHHRKSIFAWFEILMEKKILKDADVLTTVSEPLANKLQKKFIKPVHVVTNGFDPDDFDKTPGAIPSTWKETRKNAVYTGMIYPNRQDPEPLFKAIQLLVENKSIQKGDFTFWLFGPNVGYVRSLFPSELLKDFVIIGDNVPRNQGLMYQKNADLLIVFDWMDQNERGVYTTKFFEYIGAGKPILSIGYKGSVVDDALQKYRLGITENDPQLIAAILQKFITQGSLEAWLDKSPEDKNMLQQFTRKYQAEKLHGIIDRVL